MTGTLGTAWTYTNTSSLTIPFTALTGVTKLRARSSYSTVVANNSACSTYSYGETEDYFVNISMAVPCTGAPNPGNTLASANPACTGQTINFSLQYPTTGIGVTYQWNSNLNGPIAGATNSTYSMTYSGYDEIYCDVTCIYSGLTTSSNFIAVNQKPWYNCYCTPSYTSGTLGCFYGVINNVTLNTLNHNPACLNASPYTFQNTPTGSATTTLIPGQTYTLSVTSGYYNGVGVWIDWNQNGTYDASEFINISGNNNSAGVIWTGTATVTVPLTALSGITGMRVMTAYYCCYPAPIASTGACTAYTYGEDEDYLISITPLPAVPPTPVEVGTPNCASGGQIAASGSAPAGETWYWQTSATGTSTANNAASNLVIWANGTYYIRSQNNTYGTWSNGAASVTVTDFPVGPVDPSISSPANPACGAVTLISSTALAGTTNYWQGTNATGTSNAQVADNGSTNTPYSASSNTTYYLRAQDNTSFCWSNPVPVIVSIYPLPTAPILGATPGTVCPGSTVALTALAPSAPPSGYTTASIPYGPTTPPATTNPGPVGDDVVSSSIPIGFNFNFYGTTYSSFIISTNGFISFDAAPGAGCCAGQALPSAVAPNNVVAVCWTDLNTAVSGNIDYYNLTSPNRMVIRWNNVGHYAGTAQVTSEIILYESGYIDIQNTSINSQGTMTQGIENSAGTIATPVPGRNASGWTAANDAYRFLPVQPIGFLWSPNGPGSGINAGDQTLANITITPPATTTYTMTLTDPTHGCINSGTITVGVASVPPAPVTVGGATLCGSGTATLTATGTGGTLNWYNQPSGGTLQGTGSPFTTPVINATTTYYVEEFNVLGQVHVLRLLHPIHRLFQFQQVQAQLLFVLDLM